MAVIVRLASGQRETDRQPTGIDECMNFGRQSASRPAHQLFTVASGAGSVLVHSDDGGINHLHDCIMACGQRIQKLVPHVGSAPANKAFVASGVGAKVIRQIAPRRARTQDPKDAVEHAAVIYTRHAARLVRQERLDGDGSRLRLESRARRRHQIATARRGRFQYPDFIPPFGTQPTWRNLI
jgi:hypothetical protein